MSSIFPLTLSLAFSLLLHPAQDAFAASPLPHAPELQSLSLATPVLAWEQDDSSSKTGSNKGLSILRGALVPGLDQAMNGYWGRAAVFALVEVGTFMLVKSLNDEGDDLDREFRAFAEDHWEYDRYVALRMHPGEYALEEGYLNRAFSEEDLAGLSGAEIDALFSDLADDEFDPNGGQGSHILPGYFSGGFHVGDAYAWDHFSLNRTQQFYEMIGKYGQFQRGWEDYGADHGFEFAPQMPWDSFYFSDFSQQYDAMRDKSNDKLIAADRMSSLIFMNHLASLLEVLIRNKVAPDLRADMTWLGDPRQPVAGLRFTLPLGAR